MDDNLGFILLLLLGAFLIWFFVFRETEEQRQARIRREQKLEEERLERERQRAKAKIEFDEFVSGGIPPTVRINHKSFVRENPLPPGRAWYGEDVSPLTFYGYRVGKARGLNQAARQEIISYVMRARLTAPLAQYYQATWGPPLSRQRRSAIISHVNKLASQRANRRGYEVAVNEWRTDAKWAGRVLQREAARLGEFGFK